MIDVVRDHCFPRKRDFYVARLRRAADDPLAAVALAVLSPVGDRLGEGIDAYLGYVETHARGFVSLMCGAVGSDGEVRALVAGPARSQPLAAVGA